MKRSQPPPTARQGRGATVDPANRFESVRLEDDWEQLDATEGSTTPRRAPTQLLPDQTRQIIVENNSPDIPFRYSINPYRGCEHGCSYCYARPYHEYLGMNAGIDFESKILFKHEAAACLREELNRPGWRGEVIAMSGVTDCYQPVERRLRITRSLLEVMLEAEQAVGLITKNALVTRDLDLLAPLAERRLVVANVSLTTLDARLASKMEPRTATPAARLRAIQALSAAGVPVRVMTAPIIPGLNDHELPEILTAASDAGARSASMVLLRLPQAVEPIFLAWLAEHFPEKRDRVIGLIRGVRDGQLSDPRFGSRMRGQGPYAAGIRNTFDVFTRRLKLDQPVPPLDTSRFRPPTGRDGQRRLF